MLKKEMMALNQVGKDFNRERASRKREKNTEKGQGETGKRLMGEEGGS